jgi:hypothetical protein
MAIQFHDPEGESAIEETAYELSITLGSNSTAKIGLLANGFPDSEQFLTLLEASLLKHSPGLDIRRYNKGNASVPASSELLSAISADCEGLVTAYGH